MHRHNLVATPQVHQRTLPDHPYQQHAPSHRPPHVVVPPSLTTNSTRPRISTCTRPVRTEISCTPAQNSTVQYSPARHSTTQIQRLTYDSEALCTNTHSSSNLTSRAPSQTELDSPHPLPKLDSLPNAVLQHDLLDQEIILLAYQLQDFVRTKHGYSKLLSWTTRTFIDEIVRHNPDPRPRSSTPVQTSLSSSRRSRSLSTPGYPSDWTIDKTAFKQAIRHLDSIRLDVAPRVLPIFTPPGEDLPSVPGQDCVTLNDCTPSAGTGPDIGSLNITSSPVRISPVMANPAPVMFSQEQFQTLMTGLLATVAAPTAGNSTYTKQFRARDIGYFEPDNEAQNPVETSDNHTVYHNVFSFTERLRVKKDEEHLIKNLDQCLFSKADR